MANKIVLAWTVSVAGTPLSPTQAATAMGQSNVPFYQSTTADPVLGQFFGLTVDSDVTSTGASSATRTLTLNMTPAVSPHAPPPFPCNPLTATPPTLPFELLQPVDLDGEFLTIPGSNIVATSQPQTQTISGHPLVQFAAQPGVFYEVATVAAAQITLTTPYAGPIVADGDAVLMEENPVTIAAIWSTSPLDTSGIVTADPPVPAGAGAQTVSISYEDSAGGSNTLVTSLLGTMPALLALPLAPAAGFDIAAITDMHIVGTGAFGNSVGQITLVSLSAVPLAIQPSIEPDELQALTDETQLLIDRSIAYLPPSYFALAQPGDAQPALEGSFIVTPGSRSVPADTSQVGIVAATNIVEFAAQPGVQYEVAAVSPGLLTLDEPYTGLEQATSDATLISPSLAAPPDDSALAGPLAQFVNPGSAIPPPPPPFAPATMLPQVTVGGPPPNFLSDFFAQTLALALGVPVAPLPISFV